MRIASVPVLKLLILAFATSASALLHAELDEASEKWIEETLAQMTLEEKVAMTHGQSKFSSAGVPRLGVPDIWMSDGPHGVRAEFAWDTWAYADWRNDECTAFPALTCLAATFNPDLARQYGIALGEEARFREKDVLLGPGVNIYRTPFNGRNFEYMGEDPFLSSRMCVPYIQGVQSNGVAACVKHFALNNQEQWRNEVDVEVSDRALREIYLPAFKAAVTEGEAWTLMGSYNKYRGEHCSHNQTLLNGILKGEWGYDGVVISDWNAVHDTTEAAMNGLDIEMGTSSNGIYAYNFVPDKHYYLAVPFLDKLKDGSIPVSAVDEKVRRILRLSLRTSMNREKPFGRMICDEHSSVAREVAREGMVLLKNADGVFPIDTEKPLVIAVIGENATRRMTIRGGSSELKAAYEISPLQGIQERFCNATILHATGYVSEAKKEDTDAAPLNREKEAIYLAGKADLVLFVGGLNKNPGQDAEGSDRAQYHLPYEQDALIRKILQVNPNVGVLLVSGNAVAMPWINDVQAVMQVWYLGSETGHAIADILSGDVSPSGKLPFTFPREIGDSPAHAMGEMAFPGIDKKQIYKEGIFVGYRWYEHQKIEPQFAFGHGLSYTTFETADIAVDSAKVGVGDIFRVTCTIANTGACDGAEVVQVYVGKPDSGIERAEKELKGFKKVSLHPGESETVEIAIPVESLAYYDEASASWQVEPGNYRVSVGNASNRIVESLTISVGE